MTLRRLQYQNLLIPLLKPPKSHSSSATLLRFSSQPQDPPGPSLPPLQPIPQLDPKANPIPQIVSLLQTTDPDDWPADIRLSHLLLSASPSSHLKVARQLGSSQKSLLFFNYVNDSHRPYSSSTSPPQGISPLSFVFQAVLEHAVREEGLNAPVKLQELFNFAKEKKVPLLACSATLLIKSFAQAKMLETSIDVFDELDPKSRNINVVNLLLSSMLKSGKIDGALKVVDEMLKSEFEVCPNRNTLDIVLSAVLTGNWSGRSLSDEEIFGIVSAFGEHGVFPSSVWLTQLVTKFCRVGKCYKAWDLLHEVMRLGGEIQPAPCNALLTGLGKERNIKRMNLLMQEMKERGIEPDVLTFGILINHLCKSRRVDQALEVFRRMTGENEGDNVSVEPDVVIYNTLIDGLCKVGRHEEGLDLMENMRLKHGCRPNTITYNCLIDGLCKAGEIERAFELFDQMSKKGVEPNVVTLNTLLDGMCRSGRVSSAMDFFNEMQEKGLKGNAITYTVLITAFCAANNIGKAMKLFNQMLQSGCSPDEVVYYSLISGLTQSGRMDDASSVVSKMKEAGFCLDIISYNVLIGGFCRKNKLDKAYDLFKGMEDAGMKPDRVTYNTLISHFSEKGDFSTAHRVLKKMTKDGLVPNVVTFGALIHAYCKAGYLDEAMNIYRDMNSTSKVSVNDVIYTTLIDAQCKSDKIEVALSIMDDMKKKGVRPNTKTYNAMFKGLRERNWMEKALSLMDEMTEKACNPDYITLEILTEWLSAAGQIEKLRSFVRGYEVSSSVH